MTCEELKDVFELYSLGLLEEDEASEVEAHLSRRCPTCRDSLSTALAVNGIVLGLTPQVAPPARLKHRVMASVGVDRARWGWLGAVAAAFLVVLALWFGNQERQRSAELAQARQNIIQVTSERDRLEQAFRILDQPETLQLTFGKGKPQPARGNVFIHSRLGVMLLASNLPKLGPGRIYEMWLLPKQGAPRPAGLFQSSDAQSAMHILSGPIDAASLSGVAVTVEPETGSPAPTTTPLIVATGI